MTQASFDTPVVVDAVRTPQGRKDGILAELYPEDLVVAILDALTERTGINPEQWDEFRLGCANQEGMQGRNLARQSLLVGGYPESVPAVTENQLCGSSLLSLIDAARAVAVGDVSVVPVAGVEHMSHVGFSDWLHPNMADRYDTDALPMGKTAEKLARTHGIGRRVQDRFALRSHRKASEAWTSGRFKDEVVPIETSGGKKNRDETPRPDTSFKDLQQLTPVFSSDEKATVTAGNASPLTDGAAGVMVTSESFAEEHGLNVLAQIHEHGVVGVDPRMMGQGPIPATEVVLERAEIGIEDIDLVELNEAFASQAIYCQRELSIPTNRLNVNGGAIALGHPLGCSGVRITTTLLYELARMDGRHGLATMCVGFGQGVAVLFERPQP